MRHYITSFLAIALGVNAWAAKPERPGMNRVETTSEIAMVPSFDIQTAGKRNPFLTPTKKRLGERNPLTPPFCETFDNFRAGMEFDDFDRYFQVIDENDDGRYWRLYNYAAEPYGKSAYLLYPLDGTKADDYLIPRAMQLEGGKHYCVSIDAALYIGGTDHTLEVKFGPYNDAKGLSTTVIPPTTINTQKFKHLEGWIHPLDDGVYYIGVHALTANSDYLFVDNIAVGAAKAGTSPATADNLKMVNDPDGVPSVEIVFNAPSKDLDGNALTQKMTIVVERGSDVVATFTDKAPGQECRFTDNPGEEGDYSYRITASNADGEGATLRADHFVGMAAPVAPEIVSFEELPDYRYRCSWTTPATDINGTAINPSKITYCLYDISHGTPAPIAEGVTGNEIVLAANMEGRCQTMAALLVTAMVDLKESEPAATDLIVVGDPYPLPYHNSFAGADIDNYVMASESSTTDVVWRFITDTSDPKSQDNDNGYICMIGTAPNQKGEVFTGKIDLTKASAPALSFYVYNYSDDNNDFRVFVTDVATGEKTQIAYDQLYDLPRVGWNRVFYPLDDFAGKVVRISVQPRIVSHGYFPIDNMLVDQLHEVDLRIDAVSAPRSARPDESFKIKTKVFNNGCKDAGQFKLVLSRDGKDVASTTVDGLQSLESVDVELFDTFTATTSSMPRMAVRAEIDSEENPDDNLSDEFSVAFRAPNHPRIKDLQGSENGTAVKLSWSEPDLSKAAPAECVEDFEAYEAFSTQFGDWTMIDGDKGVVGGFQDITMPVDNTPQAFWIMETVDPYNFIDAASGMKAAVQMFTMDTDRKSVIDCDDWLISPELYGGPQTITFMASSLSTAYGYDKFEVYYSTTGNSRECFKRIGVETEPTDYWLEYVVGLPDGAKYFAIRCISYDTYMLMLDDFTFTPKGTPQTLELKGYNVYRNNEKLTPEPIKQMEFSTARQLETDIYFVTAVYDRGESVASNIVAFGKDGVEEIAADGSDEATCEVFDLRGIRVDQRNAAPGVYLRRQGSKVDKIIIR